MILLDTVQSHSSDRAKEYMTNLTRTRYLMGNPYAAAIKHGGLWHSVDRAGVLWPPAHEKPGPLLVLIRPGPLPPMQKLSSFNSVASLSFESVNSMGNYPFRDVAVSLYITTVPPPALVSPLAWIVQLSKFDAAGYI
ncbi:unnamed protein product [Urochloa humidicola]